MNDYEKYIAQVEKNKKIKAQDHLTFLANRFNGPYRWWKTSSLPKHKLDHSLCCKNCRQPVIEHWRLGSNLANKFGTRKYCYRDASAYSHETYIKI